MPGVARRWDQEVGPMHCTQPKRFGAFRTVFANGIKMSGVGHINTPWHKIFIPAPVNKCKSHSKKLLKGSPNVFAEGRPIGRKGDPTGCSIVVKGSRNVFANGGGGGGLLGTYSQSAVDAGVQAAEDDI
jgi:uncharacterized Zn-binding protein involved in type VI secretion